MSFQISLNIIIKETSRQRVFCNNVLAKRLEIADSLLLFVYGIFPFSIIIPISQPLHQGYKFSRFINKKDHLTDIN